MKIQHSEEYDQYYAFVDRSEALKQHGILGMKWGVWNEETRIRRMGGKGRNSNSSGKIDISSTQSKYDLKNKKYKSTIAEIKDDAKKVNGGAMAVAFAKNRSNNCAYCTAAYELRRRGYDVKAAEAIVGVDLISHPDLMFKDAKSNLLVNNSEYKKDKEGNYILDKYGNKQLSNSSLYFKKGGITKDQFNDIEKELVKQGEGARGNIYGTFVGSAFAGHSMAYEIVNGKLCIIDAQVGTVHDGSSFTKNPYQDVKNFRELYYTRTDNLQINEKTINNFVTNSSTKTRINTAQIAKDVLSITSLFFPPAALLYYAIDIPDSIKSMNETSKAYDNLKERGY